MFVADVKCSQATWQMVSDLLWYRTIITSTISFLFWKKCFYLRMWSLWEFCALCMVVSLV